MSSWTRIETAQIGPRTWVCRRAATFEIGGLPSPTGTRVTVPVGFTCDLASVPWFARWLVSKDALAPAGLLHDYLLSQGWTRLVADAVFYEAARVCAGRGLSVAGYVGVRVGSLLGIGRR